MNKTFKTGRVLVTNDDGPDSPLLLPFLDCLKLRSWCMSLMVAVPAEEQSWISGAITRFRPVFVASHKFGSHHGVLISGTPADCASIGIHNLSEETPNLLISGINIGNNAGLGFYLSSGTIGAAERGFLHQVPSLAISLEVPTEIFNARERGKDQELRDYHDQWIKISLAALDIIQTLIENNAWQHADFFSINLPFNITENSKVRISALGETYLKSLFIEEGKNRYIHQFSGLQRLSGSHSPEPSTTAHNPLAENPLVQRPLGVSSEKTSKLPSDFSVLESGDISLTPIRYQLTATESEELLKLFNS